MGKAILYDLHFMQDILAEFAIFAKGLRFVRGTFFPVEGARDRTHLRIPLTTEERAQIPAQQVSLPFRNSPTAAHHGFSGEQLVDKLRLE
jgi:hypothetical protein